MGNILVHPHHPPGASGDERVYRWSRWPRWGRGAIDIKNCTWGNGIDWLIFYCNLLKKTMLFPREVPGASDIYSIYFGQIMWLETTCLFELWSAAQRVNAVQKGICLLHVGVHCRNSAKNWVSRCTSHGARICLMMVTSYREDPCLF